MKTESFDVLELFQKHGWEINEPIKENHYSPTSRRPRGNFCRSNALHRAAQGGRIDVLEWLLDEVGFPVNQREYEYHNDYQWTETALYYAVKGNALDCVRLLLQLGADVSVRDEKDLTVRDVGLQQGHEKVDQDKLGSLGILPTRMLYQDLPIHKLLRPFFKIIPDIAIRRPLKVQLIRIFHDVRFQPQLAVYHIFQLRYKLQVDVFLYPQVNARNNFGDVLFGLVYICLAWVVVLEDDAMVGQNHYAEAGLEALAAEYCWLVVEHLEPFRVDVDYLYRNIDPSSYIYWLCLDELEAVPQLAPSDLPGINPLEDWPHIEYLVLDQVFAEGADSSNGLADKRPYVAASLGPVATFSRGNVSIVSSDATVNPVISLNCLEDARDQEILLTAFRRNRELFKTQALKPVAVFNAFPGANDTLTADQLHIIRERINSVYRTTGTNSRINEPDEVFKVS
ncbi:uncharacterized protein KD926_007680 [Aspergillus affinis]|uniref:uncharacterized protein n=1 Tax=Aspergillus affinis TaxID=1070780 RepID=UPI0022FDB387|nr:uncharacterized protein KD926_007680 [Aspergillus affinis]KAI9040738.1 hypothetical protein KD926_007680 [Aspergillus affinis]